jgi:hypothetical protein
MRPPARLSGEMGQAPRTALRIGPPEGTDAAHRRYPAAGMMIAMPPVSARRTHAPRSRARARSPRSRSTGTRPHAPHRAPKTRAGRVDPAWKTLLRMGKVPVRPADTVAVPCPGGSRPEASEASFAPSGRRVRSGRRRALPCVAFYPRVQSYVPGDSGVWSISRTYCRTNSGGAARPRAAETGHEPAPDRVAPGHSRAAPCTVRPVRLPTRCPRAPRS